MEVRDLEGRDWIVQRQWLPRLEGRGLARFRAASARRRAEKGDSRSRWWDALDFPVGGDDTLGTIVAVIGVIILVVVLVLWGLPLLLALGDLVLALALGAIGLVSREVLRRPWTVEAVRDDGSRLTRPVVGFRAAGRARDSWAEELRHGRGLEPPVA